MKFITFGFLFFILFNYLIVFSFEEVNSTFRATKEWQRVEKGQTLPPGLWLRIDFKANIREAKIPDEEELRALGLVLGQEGEEDDKFKVNVEELKEILKKIRPKDYLKNERKSVKYRSFMEFKKDLNDINVKFKTDFDILLNLVLNFKKYEFNKVILPNGQTSEVPNDEEVLSALVDLEYLVHHIDNAQEFARLNGFVDVIHKCLNSTNSEIRSEALRLHGSATQSNPDTQIAAFQAGSIPLLLKILSFDQDVHVQARSLFALSCLVRQFPAAQYKLIFEGGLSVFASLFDDTNEDPLKLQLKVAILFQDLLLERKDVLLTIIEEEEKDEETQTLAELRERQRQYDEINLDRRLVEQNWCSRISNWVIKQDLMLEFERATDIGKDLSPAGSDLHDLINKMVDTVYVVSDMCESDFQHHRELVALISNLKDIYSLLAATEPEDDKNYSNIYSNLLSVLEIIKNKLKKNALPEEKY